MITPELWRKIFSRGRICAVCGEIIEEENPPKLHDAVMHRECLERDVGEALF